MWILLGCFIVCCLAEFKLLSHRLDSPLRPGEWVVIEAETVNHRLDDFKTVAFMLSDTPSPQYSHGVIVTNSLVLTLRKSDIKQAHHAEPYPIVYYTKVVKGEHDMTDAFEEERLDYIKTTNISRIIFRIRASVSLKDYSVWAGRRFIGVVPRMVTQYGNRNSIVEYIVSSANENDVVQLKGHKIYPGLTQAFPTTKELKTFPLNFTPGSGGDVTNWLDLLMLFGQESTQFELSIYSAKKPDRKLFNLKINNLGRYEDEMIFNLYTGLGSGDAFGFGNPMKRNDMFHLALSSASNSFGVYIRHSHDSQAVQCNHKALGEDYGRIEFIGDGQLLEIQTGKPEWISYVTNTKKSASIVVAN